MEERKETRWYLLWFLTAAMWGITFCGSREEGFHHILQFANVWLSLGAGIVNGLRYKKKNGTW